MIIIYFYWFALKPCYHNLDKYKQLKLDLYVFVCLFFTVNFKLTSKFNRNTKLKPHVYLWLMKNLQ